MYETNRASILEFDTAHTENYAADADAIKTQSLSVSYNGKKALSDVSVTFHAGTITGIVGPNGAGKSTLIKAIMKLVDLDTGIVNINGNSLERERKNIAYIEQRSALDLSFPISVFDTVLLGTYPKLGLIRRPGENEKNIAAKALETVKMIDFSKRQIGELSGGQLQRVFIARALAQDADIFLLDEPFVGIDMVSEELIMEILFALRREGKTIAIVHHDLNKVSKYFDDLIILNRKLIADGKVNDVFTIDNIQKAYGETLDPILYQGGSQK